MEVFIDGRKVDAQLITFSEKSFEVSFYLQPSVDPIVSIPTLVTPSGKRLHVWTKQLTLEEVAKKLRG